MEPKEITIAVTFVVPVTIRITNDQVNKDEIVKAVTATAKKKLATGNYPPLSMEQIYEAVSENEARGHEVPGVKNRWIEIYNHLGTSGWKNTDIYKNLQGHESGKIERNYPRTTSRIGNEGKNHSKDERGIYFDKTV